MLVPVLSLVGGLVILVVGASALVRGAAALALRLGLTPLVVGLTVVAFGTSAPELLVSVQASLRDAGDIAVGNVVGSNIANIALILGISALVRPVETSQSLLRRDVPLMIGASVLVAAMLVDGRLGRIEGAFLALGLLAYIAYSIRTARRETAAAAALAPSAEELPKPSANPLVDGLFVVGGLAGLVLGANWLVDGAVVLAEAFGVSKAVIGLTVVAVGTSLPELATSIVAALRGETAIAAGNVIGSNLFNLLGILGLASLVHPLVAPAIDTVSLIAMVAVALVIFPLMATGARLSRGEGVMLLAGYVAYLVYLAQSPGATA